ncbi:hypothetical protein PGB28_07855 [Primorskyibacter aestuariivivens]|uniref:hypothetical protein n=1 Tax=Primorskyibacter aestuariivivens TaxID=1888912 RepID=UPI002301944A|nr:hypothetical protein [Primorskyibacter aestuariivivens]MDA7428369.1 hypothetical protein [Primorskyibacter aestuariivivens]
MSFLHGHDPENGADMSVGSVLWLLAGLVMGLCAGWAMCARRNMAQVVSRQQQIERLKQELSDSVAATADRDARIATLEAEQELAAPRQASRAR